MRRVLAVLALGLGLILAVGEVGAQTSLADYDYENLSFRGFSFEGGYIWPTRVKHTYTMGARVVLGYLGPGIRLVPGVAYWSSTMKNSEVRKLLSQRYAIRRKPGLGTEPKVYYLI